MLRSLLIFNRPNRPDYRHCLLVYAAFIVISPQQIHGITTWCRSSGDSAASSGAVSCFETRSCQPVAHWGRLMLARQGDSRCG